MTGAVESTVAAAQRGGIVKSLLNSILKAFRGIKVRRKLRSLQVLETLPLGDKRLLALVDWQGEKLLVGITPQNISLLVSRRTPRPGDDCQTTGSDE